MSGSHRRRRRTGEVGVKKLFKLDSLIAKSHALFFLYPSNHKILQSAASLGAMVSFALSIIFTWRFLRARKLIIIKN
ncbi:hypothetical protein BDE02_10G085300 [Populus trichocarpa]|nr:hypothetical protein BDE02_10G085300 [Populus trichocarpa]